LFCTPVWFGAVNPSGKMSLYQGQLAIQEIHGKNSWEKFMKSLSQKKGTKHL
jgi:hypothetical protein